MNLKKYITLLSTITFISLSTVSCSPGRFYNETYSETKRLELGTVQKEICEGLAQDEVALILGTPNIVTADKDKKETWIYDKITTEVRQSGSSGLILFFQTGADYVTRRDSSQKTLTVVIKFNSDKLVESVSYHSSKF
jgi:outer membrane protein assembly factor BamE (lipoprotein component of BamABCDE complex)